MGENLQITQQEISALLAEFARNGVTDLTSSTPFNWYENSFTSAALKPSPSQLAPLPEKRSVKAKPKTLKKQETVLNPTQSIWVIGNPQAKLTLLTAALPTQFGQMPFSTEEQTLLSNILKAIGLTMDDINIAATTATCPEGTPLSVKNIQQLYAHAQKQLETLAPQNILCFGQVPMNVFHNNDHIPLTKLRADQPQISSKTSAKTVTTYHPKHLLKTPLLKKRTWQDLQPFVRIFTS